ncbi:unnamed protein product [Caenorhabditis brenneri]
MPSLNNSPRVVEQMLLDLGSSDLDRTASQRTKSKHSLSSCFMWTVLAIAIVTMAYGLTETTLYFLSTGACGSEEPRKPPMKYGDCDSDWVSVNRTGTGQKYCHRFFSDRLTYEEAEKKCQEYGAHLSGFTGQNELDILDKMLDEAISKGARYDGSDNVWIGARRRAVCSTREGLEVEEGGFNPDPNHPCSRSRVFEWVNGVAPNPPDFKDRWVAEMEPSFHYNAENCVELLKGVKHWVLWPKDVVGDKKLNDVHCAYKLSYLCGKEATIVKTDE